MNSTCSKGPQTQSSDSSWILYRYRLQTQELHVSDVEESESEEEDELEEECSDNQSLHASKNGLSDVESEDFSDDREDLGRSYLYNDINHIQEDVFEDAAEEEPQTLAVPVSGGKQQ